MKKYVICEEPNLCQKAWKQDISIKSQVAKNSHLTAGYSRRLARFPSCYLLLISYYFIMICLMYPAFSIAPGPAVLLK